MNKPDHIRRKRALYTGLQPFLRDTELMDALILWESQYANTPTFSVRYFLADLTKKIPRPLETKRLLVNLVSSLGKQESELLPDPSKALEAYKKRKNIQSNTNFTIPELEAFQLLIDKWILLAPPESRKDVVYFVVSSLPRRKISGDLKIKLQDWLVDPSRKIRVPNVSSKDLRQIINLFYVGFCEYLGPVKTDELLAKAVSALKNNGGAAYSQIFPKFL